MTDEERLERSYEVIGALTTFFKEHGTDVIVAHAAMIAMLGVFDMVSHEGFTQAHTIAKELGRRYDASKANRGQA